MLQENELNIIAVKASSKWNMKCVKVEIRSIVNKRLFSFFTITHIHVVDPLTNLSRFQWIEIHLPIVCCRNFPSHEILERVKEINLHVKIYKFVLRLLGKCDTCYWYSQSEMFISHSLWCAVVLGRWWWSANIERELRVFLESFIMEIENPSLILVEIFTWI